MLKASVAIDGDFSRLLVSLAFIPRKLGRPLWPRLPRLFIYWFAGSIVMFVSVKVEVLLRT